MVSSCGDDSNQDANPDKYTLNVIATRVEEGNAVRPLRVTGTVEAAMSRDISFRVGGTITARHVQTGDRVKAGDLLATIGTSELDANVTAAEADVASAAAGLSLAQSDLDRLQSLFEKGFTTRSGLDNAGKAVDQAKASLSIAESQLEIARENRSYADLKAGADGVVVGTNAEVGQVVQAGQPVMTIASNDRRQAVFDVSEAVLTAANADNAKVFLASDPSVVAKAKIAEISPTVNRNTGTVRLKVDLIDPPESMNLGAPVTGEVESKPIHGFVLPPSALSNYAGKAAVWVFDASTHTVSPKPVEALFYSHDQAVVTGQLETGDLVVSGGTPFLSPGLEVTVSKEQP
ncbi:efflux RND transporter periplasmic adaptor subunit [Rhizobium sp. L1K21]|uniref:efflux RND transporter periplasmic adaptor subunit n=1 Tax=Rhizobium sp. L1K21 TaxID=2954933 RepID=UPI0020935092|nr:efflux RND transporter periplasmic adaptor subunit [Rhizobium sp. L1K21]MCO6186010.1 efflux RND transporter periplasmic adaptor subunit [Rhizobium sp. L1K21]